jgi:large subunit ribosomal protein L30
MAGNLKITLKRSPIGRAEKLKKVLTGLGLTRVSKTVVRKDTPEVRGMINKVSFMVAVEETA